jgi:hypothetical protein
VFWNVLIDWTTSRFPFVERLFSGQRLCLVRNGRPEDGGGNPRRRKPTP